MDNPVQNWLMTVLKRILMVRDTTPSWCIMREGGLEPTIQLVPGGNAAVQSEYLHC